jgi:hypothetical protein
VSGAISKLNQALEICADREDIDANGNPDAWMRVAGLLNESLQAMQGEVAPQPAVPEEVYTALVGVCTAACDGVVLVRYEDWNKIVDWVNGLLSAAKGE